MKSEGKREIVDSGVTLPGGRRHFIFTLVREGEAYDLGFENGQERM
jgi:hypothetical protein